MYMLMTYDVEASRTVKFMKLLRKYLEHTQYSVFSGDISEAKAIELRCSINKLMIPGDKLTEITAANRHNINIVHLSKNDSGKGETIRNESIRHKSDFEVL